MSIVIPTYNRVEMLMEAIQALLAQTFRNYELIIVDNGPSTDDTGERVKVLMQDDDRIVYISTTEQGDFVARTIGCQYASGDVLLTIDDDWEMTDPDSLQYIVDSFRHDPNLGVLGLAPKTKTFEMLSHPADTKTKIKVALMRFIYRPGRISRWGFPKTRFYYLPPGRKNMVDHVRGCCLAFPRGMGQRIGYFPGFYNALCGGIGYRSETELCCQLHRHGYKVIYSTEKLGLHKSATRQMGSAPRAKTPKVFRCQAQNNILFFLRNFWSPATAPIFLVADVLLGNRGQPGLVYFVLHPRYLLKPKSLLASLRGKVDGFVKYYRGYKAA